MSQKLTLRPQVRKPMALRPVEASIPQENLDTPRMIILLACGCQTPTPSHQIAEGSPRHHLTRSLQGRAVAPIAISKRCIQTRTQICSYYCCGITEVLKVLCTRTCNASSERTIALPLRTREQGVWTAATCALTRQTRIFFLTTNSSDVGVIHGRIPAAGSVVPPCLIVSASRRS